MSTATGGAGGALRPYVITRGRARAAHARLGLDTLLTALAGEHELPVSATGEERTLVRLCARPTALAEAAARLGLAVGLVRVLVSDLIGSGRMSARDGDRSRPDTQLLQEVLNGLRRMR